MESRGCLSPSRTLAVITALFCSGLLASCSGGGGGAGVVTVSQAARPFIHESQFGLDASLKARPETVVALELEKGLPAQRNSIPYVFEKTGDYNFCIDENDPLIVSATLADSEGTPLAELDRAHRCRELTITAGVYTLHVHHDGTAVDDQKMHAFIHTPKADLPKAAAASSASVSKGGKRSTAAARTIGSVPVGPDVFQYLTFEAANGKPLRINEPDIFGRGPQNMQTPYTIFASDDNSWQLLSLQFNATSGPAIFNCQWFYYCCLRSDAPLAEGVPVRMGVYYPTAGIDQCFDEVLHVSDSHILNYAIQNRGDRFALTVQSQNSSAWYNLALMDDGSMAASTDSAKGSLRVQSVMSLRPEQYQQPLQKGHVALYGNSDCQGAATVVLPEGASSTHFINRYTLSMQAGHDTRASITQKGASRDPIVLGQGSPFCYNIPWDIMLNNGGALSFITDAVTIQYTQDILISSRQCRYCDLGSAQLSNAQLDGVDLSYSYLANAVLSNTSLKGANLSNAVLSGANISFSNLKGANMCGTFLNGNAESAGATNLEFAYMKNVNLGGANLSGADMSYVSFYSDDSAPMPCVPTACDGTTPWTARCATVAGATMIGTKLNDAYLTGVDFSGINAKNVSFSGSILSGASFRGADLAKDPNTTGGTNFTSAFLQAADFTNASVAGANFINAYIDREGGRNLGFKLKGQNTSFAGFWQSPGSAICVRYAYSDPTKTPVVDSSNICPDGKNFGAQYCSDGSTLFQGACTGGGTVVTDDCWSRPPTVPMDKLLLEAGFDICDPFTADPNW